MPYMRCVQLCCKIFTCGNLCRFLALATQPSTNVERYGLIGLMGLRVVQTDTCYRSDVEMPIGYGVMMRARATVSTFVCTVLTEASGMWCLVTYACGNQKPHSFRFSPLCGHFLRIRRFRTLINIEACRLWPLQRFNGLFNNINEKLFKLFREAEGSLDCIVKTGVDSIVEVAYVHSWGWTY